MAFPVSLRPPHLSVSLSLSLATGSSNASKHHSPATVMKPAKRDVADDLAGNPPPNPSATEFMDVDDEHEALGAAAFLSREEVLRRRSRRLKNLMRYYRDQLWALMEEVKVRHRDYYWEFGKSPFEDGGDCAEAGEGSEEGGKGEVPAVVGGIGAPEAGKKGEREKCGISGCKAYAMPLTRYCHSHILSDAKQTLYKACSYVIKSAHNGPIICGKPVLRAATPSLCPVHFQKAQKHVSRALKKAGLNISASNRPAPKFHILISEYARQIQAKRREALEANAEPVGDKNEKDQLGFPP